MRRHCRTLMWIVLGAGAAAAAVRPAPGTSLWEKRTPTAAYTYGDDRARMVGDIVTIVIEESFTTKRGSELKTAKKETILHRLTSIFYPPTSSKLGTYKGKLPEISRETNNSFDGSGQLDNSDSFKGTITAQVVEVRPNGNLLIEGNRHIRVTDEDQLVTISGVARPQDIGPNNQVSSTMLADVQINYKGKGAIRDNQKRSVLTRLWDKINLF